MPIDLAPYANRGFADEIENDGKGGWFDQGRNDFRTMPTGNVTAAGILFRIVDPAKNNGKGCLITAGSARPDFPHAIKGIKVNGKFSRLFFLHTAAWGGAADAGRYRINYADGSSVELPLGGNRNIGDWWNPAPLAEARVGVMRKNAAGNNIGAYVMEWENPHPDAVIASIDFLSPLYREQNRIDWLPANTAFPALIAVTGETAHPSPVDITGRDFVKCSPAKESGSKIPGKVQKLRDGWNIKFRSSPPGEVPAAFFVFSEKAMSGPYDTLVLQVRSRWDGEVEVVLPEKEWRGRYSGRIELSGDGELHTWRLRLGRELKKSGRIAPDQLRNELFFFYRGSTARPAQEFTVEGAKLE